MKLLSQYPKEVKAFLVASLVASAGGSLMWPLTTMYVFDELNRSMQDAGLVILIQSLGGIIGQLLGGALYHKVGVKRLIVGSLLLNALGLFSLPLINGYWSLLIVTMGLVGLFNAVSMPAIQAFIGFRFADRRGELFNVVYVANNIGVALGTAMSGFLAEISYHLSFVLNGVTSFGFAVFFLIYLTKLDAPKEAAGPALRKTPLSAGPGAWALLSHTRIYLYMGLGSLFLWFGNSIWNTGVSPFIISEGMSKAAYGYLWTLNGILIFAAQPLVGLIRRWLARTESSQMTASALFYLAAYVVIALMQSYPGLVLAMVLATLGEMLISPAIPAFISERAGRSAPFYIGVAGGMGAAGRVLGPYFMGTMFDSGGLTPVAWLAAATAVLSCIAFVVHARMSHHFTLPEDAGGAPPLGGTVLQKPLLDKPSES
ncbi:MFS transporter [Paenibacillus sp. FSL M8-0334]|uniref:MFS transporter n=1 Tax=Paenibacillus campinasensis TaxID=66347 RepID=A0ABW9T494_9BACL|nr:MFS transporter [Paenibacillus campinasensis]MUG67558.1 MFS transporter [Paenibacillus campinasensis]